MKQEGNYISQREKKKPSKLPMVCLLLPQTISSFNAFQHLFKSDRNGLLLKEDYKKLCYPTLTNQKTSNSDISETAPVQTYKPTRGHAEASHNPKDDQYSTEKFLETKLCLFGEPVSLHHCPPCLRILLASS